MLEEGKGKSEGQKVGKKMKECEGKEDVKYQEEDLRLNAR